MIVKINPLALNVATDALWNSELLEEYQGSKLEVEQAARITITTYLEQIATTAELGLKSFYL